MRESGVSVIMVFIVVAEAAWCEPRMSYVASMNNERAARILCTGGAAGVAVKMLERSINGCE